MNSQNEKELEYYLTIQDGRGFLIYKSEPFKLSEFDLINLIKVCLIERRAVSIGKKLLEIYEDSTQHRLELTKQRLNAIGIKNKENGKPTFSRRTKEK